MIHNSCGARRVVQTLVFAAVSSAILLTYGRAVALPPNPDLDNWKGPENNCYNYAINKKDNDFKQPGGLPWPGAGGAANLTNAQWCDKVRGRAIGDGLVAVAWNPGQPIPTPPAGYNLVALGSKPGTKGRNRRTDGDYHWWRLNGDGTWSHKRGQTAAKTTYTDANNMQQQITDPRNAAQLDGYVLCGFMGVPKNPPPANHTDPGIRPPSQRVRLWQLDLSGWDAPLIDLGPIEQDRIRLHLPTISPSNQVPDPLWVEPHVGTPRGYSLLPGQGVLGFPPYLRVYQGVVAVYFDLDGQDIRYYRDNNGLQPAIETLLQTVPTVSEWGLIAIATGIMFGGLVLLRRRVA